MVPKTLNVPGLPVSLMFLIPWGCQDPLGGPTVPEGPQGSLGVTGASSTSARRPQGPCTGNQQSLAHSRLWDAVVGFLHVFAHMMKKLAQVGAGRVLGALGPPHPLLTRWPLLAVPKGERVGDTWVPSGIQQPRSFPTPNPSRWPWGTLRLRWGGPHDTPGGPHDTPSWL